MSSKYAIPDALRDFVRTKDDLVRDILLSQEVMRELSLRSDQVRRETMELRQEDDKLRSQLEHHMVLDQIFSGWEYVPTDFSSSHPTEPTSALTTGEAVSIGAVGAVTVGVAGFAMYRKAAQWSLRDTGTQMPDFDITPNSRQATPVGGTPVGGTHGETGDPSEFLSPTPAGKVKRNTRARFF